MTDRTPETLTDEERDQLLGEGGVGVLSLSAPDGDPPYTVPVSYGYDGDTETFYFRLVVGESTEKGTLDDRPASFVTYGTTEGDYWSVVAGGTLENVAKSDQSTDTLAAMDRVHIPMYDVFGAPTRDLSFEFCRLDHDTITTRRAV